MAEVADEARVEQETVRRWLRRKLLRGILLSRKGGWRVRQSDLDTFLRDRTNLPAPHLHDTAHDTDRGDAMTLQQALDSSPHATAAADLGDAVGSRCRVVRRRDGSVELTTRAAGLPTLFEVVTFAHLADLLAARPYLANLNWQPA